MSTVNRGQLLLVILFTVAFHYSHAHIHFQLGANDTMHYLVGQSTCLIGWDLLPSCIHVGSSSPNHTLLHSQLVNVETNATIQEYGPLEILPSQYVPFLYWNTSAHPVLDSNYTGFYSCVTAGQATPETYQLNVVVPPLITDMIESVAAGEVNAICSATAYPKPIISIIANGVSVDCNETSTLANGVWTSVCRAYLPMAASDESAHINCTALLPAFTCSEAQDPSVQRACENSTKSVTSLYTNNRRTQTGLSDTVVVAVSISASLAALVLLSVAGYRWRNRSSNLVSEVDFSKERNASHSRHSTSTESPTHPARKGLHKSVSVESNLIESPGENEIQVSSSSHSTVAETAASLAKQ
eukprot:scpid88506/ scgid0761/ 